MSYYPQEQRPPYPTDDPAFIPPQSYPEAYPQQQQYPPSYPQERQQQYHSPPPQQQPHYYPPPAQEQSQWNPEKIYAEANGPQQHQYNTSRGEGSLENPQSQNGERGIGAAVLGGGAGAFLGHEMGHGKMGTLGGLAVGAIAAEAFEHHHEKKKREHHLEDAYDDGYVNGESRRGIDEDEFEERRESEYEYDDEPRHHHHHHHHDRDYDDDDYDYERETYRRDDYYRDDRY